ncbi:NADP-dependent oxidoreductase [Pseudarthrobacter sulfonivorans]|uniref:NADP-dependent oxidoreductase n=1 Tax=Pseudarthrobacter sulfonivorans TaxID=121292 RepID=UPI00168BEDB4|nr:NADP-dependent oxidoreductase [Pseudarthrobacter sulfonivorans]
MKAIGVRSFGGPEALEVLALPAPDAGAGEVRIRVLAAAVNPTDTLVRSGAPQVRPFQPPKGPYVPGMDAAGVIDQVGPGADGRLAVGQSVVALVTPYGTNGAYAGQVVVPAESVVAAPVRVSIFAASTLLMNAMTARAALEAAQLSSGDTLLVTGAAGTLGGYVIQLAKQDGLYVIADAKPSDMALVESLGADRIVERGDELGVRVRQLVPQGVPGVVDGALLHDKVIPALAARGRLVTLRARAESASQKVDVRPVRVGDSARRTTELENLVRLAESGVITLRVAQVLPASRAGEAHRRLKVGGLRGRLVLDFSDLDQDPVPLCTR